MSVHVDTCLANGSAEPPPPPPPAMTAAATGAAGAAASSSSESRFGECPVCNASVPKALLPTHVEACLAKPTQAPAQAKPTPQAQDTPTVPAQAKPTVQAQDTPTVQAQEDTPAVHSFFTQPPTAVDWSRVQPGKPPRKKKKPKITYVDAGRATWRLYYVAAPDAADGLPLWHWEWAEHTPPACANDAGPLPPASTPTPSPPPPPPYPSAYAVVPSRVPTFGAAAVPDVHRLRATAAQPHAQPHAAEPPVPLPPPPSHACSERHSIVLKDKSSRTSVDVRLHTNYPPEGTTHVEVSAWDRPHRRNEFAVRAWHLPVSTLKSLLQKNVRQSRPAAAVRTALVLMRQSMADFLRRLSIIVMEDAIAHPALPFVSWLTLAEAKGFALTSAHVDTLLQIVYEIAAVEWVDRPSEWADGYEAAEPEGKAEAVEEEKEKDVREKAVEEEKEKDVGVGEKKNAEDVGDAGASPSLPSAADLAALSPVQRDFVRAIGARACMGGMLHDVGMMVQFARQWLRRLRGELPGPPTHAAPLDVPRDALPAHLRLAASDASPWMQWLVGAYARVHVRVAHTDVGPLLPEDVTLSAVDFHCSNMGDVLLGERSTLRAVLATELRMLLGRGRGADVDVDARFRHMVWTWRSSCTNKRTVRAAESAESAEHELLHMVWGHVAHRVDEFAHGYLVRRFY